MALARRAGRTCGAVAHLPHRAAVEDGQLAAQLRHPAPVAACGAEGAQLGQCLWVRNLLDQAGARQHSATCVQPALAGAPAAQLQCITQPAQLQCTTCLAGRCGPPAFRWGRPGPSAAATATPPCSCWQTAPGQEVGAAGQVTSWPGVHWTCRGSSARAACFVTAWRQSTTRVLSPPGWPCASQTASAPWLGRGGRRPPPLPAGRPCGHPTGSQGRCLRGLAGCCTVSWLLAAPGGPPGCTPAAPPGQCLATLTGTHPARRRRRSSRTGSASDGAARSKGNWLVQRQAIAAPRQHRFTSEKGLHQQRTNLHSSRAAQPPEPTFMSVHSSSKSLCSCSTASSSSGAGSEPSAR